MTERPALLRVGFVLAWSVLVWVALWSELSVANVIWGLAAGALTLAVVPVQRRAGRVVVRPLALLRLAAYFAWGLVEASAIVAWEVVSPRSRIHEGVVAAPLRTTSRGVITLIANAISLTPGTVTLEVREDPPTLYIHILHLHTIEEVRAEIRHLEDLALAAFPGAATASQEPR